MLDHLEKQEAKTKTQGMENAKLWHARFGHVGYGNLFQQHNMMQDMSFVEIPPKEVCEGYVLGKI